MVKHEEIKTWLYLVNRDCIPDVIFWVSPIATITYKPIWGIIFVKGMLNE